MYEHKNEIVKTRVGALGGSDANLIAQVASLGYVPQSAYKRLAVCKGLIEHENITNRAMEFGNFVEDSVFKLLSMTNKNFISNPLWESEKYVRKNVRLICHPDIVLFDEFNKTIRVYECKATRFPVMPTKETYRGQLYIEWLLAQEQAKKLGNDWKVHLSLCHYNTDGIDLEQEFEVESSRLTIVNVSFKGEKGRNLIDVSSALDIIDKFLDTFTEYYTGEEIESQYLPERVRTEFDAITKALNEIKEREQKVGEFKEKLYAFMLDKGIKSIKNPEWSITRVDESESKQFDGKTYMETLKAQHPRKARKIMDEFSKVIKRKGTIQIRIKK